MPFKYQPYSLESLSLYVSILSALFFSIACFGSLILLQLPKLWVALILIIFFFLLNYQYFWINKYSWNKSWPFVLIILVAMVEIYSAISYLPTGYYVNALILAVAYYLFLGLSKQSLSGNISLKKIWEFLIVGGLCLALVLISARWD